MGVRWGVSFMGISFMGISFMGWIEKAPGPCVWCGGLSETCVVYLRYQPAPRAQNDEYQKANNRQQIEGHGFNQLCEWRGQRRATCFPKDDIVYVYRQFRFNQDFIFSLGPRHISCQGWRFRGHLQRCNIL
jgi:hypothetical protein